MVDTRDIGTARMVRKTRSLNVGIVHVKIGDRSIAPGTSSNLSGRKEGRYCTLANFVDVHGHEDTASRVKSSRTAFVTTGTMDSV